MQELFELFGTLGVRTEQAFRQLDEVERRVKDLAREWVDDLNAEVTVTDHASSELDRIGESTDSAAERLQRLEDILAQVQEKLRQSMDADIDINDQSVIEAQREVENLMREIEMARQTINDATNDINVDSNVNVNSNLDVVTNQVNQLKEQLRQLETVMEGLGQGISTDLGLSHVQDNVSQLRQSLEQMETVLNTVGQQMNNLDGATATVNVNQQQGGQAGAGGGANGGGQATPFDGPYQQLSQEIDELRQAIQHLTTATAANAVSGAAQGYGSNRPYGYQNQNPYNVDRMYAYQMAMQRRMLQYAMMMTPQNVLGRVDQRLQMGSSAIPYMSQAQNLMAYQAAFGMAQSAISNSQKQLAQLGFGRTKAQIKSMEAQIHSLANIKLDTLRDQIKMTEKALKEMKGAANSHEYVEEMRKAEESLRKYKDELKNHNPMDNLARVNGLKRMSIYDKDVLVKPWTNALDAIGGKLTAFFNRDLAHLYNSAFEKIEKGAKAIVGPQTTKKEEIAKIAKLTGQYQLLGQTIRQFVTPAVLGLAAAFGMVGAKADAGFNKFQAQALFKPEDMPQYKNMITDTQVTTGASHEEVGELFSYLNNQLGKTKDNIQEAATMGLYFKKVWGVDAAEAVETVDEIAEKLHVDQKQAQDILALALKKYQGDIGKATEEVMKHKKEWKEASAASTEGAEAYERMTGGIDAGAAAAFGKAWRESGAAVLELWKAMEPTLTKIANAIADAARATTEFLRNNPGLASMVGHVLALGGAFAVLLGVLMPVAGFLIMQRKLFQGLAQAIRATSKGTAILSPQVVMMMDNLKMMTRGILGLPRILAGMIPGLLGMLRALPAAMVNWVITFVKLNPMLTAFAGIAWVAYKNWDRVGPLFQQIWDIIKRIIKSIVDAFAGPGKSGMDAFTEAMDKFAKVAGDVLVVALETVIPLLELLAKFMENGGAKFVVAGVAVWFLGGALGAIIPLFKVFGSVITGPIALVTKFGKAIGKVGKAVSKLGPLLTRLPALFAMVGNGLMALAPLLLNPWTWVVLAIAGIVYLIYKYWDDIKKYCKDTWDKISKWTKEAWEGIKSFLKDNWEAILMMVTGPFGGIVVAIVKNWDKISAKTKEIWNGIKNFLKKHWDDILAMATGPFGFIAYEVYKNWDKISKETKKIWGDVKSYLGKKWGEIKKDASKTWDGMSKDASKKWDTITKVTGIAAKAVKRRVSMEWNEMKTNSAKSWNKMKQDIEKSWGGMISSTKKGARDVYNAVKSKWDDTKKKTTQTWNEMKSTISKKWQEIKLETIRKTIEIAKDVNQKWNTIKKDTGIIWQATKTILKSKLDGMKQDASNVLSAIKKIATDRYNELKKNVTDSMEKTRKSANEKWENMKRTTSEATNAIKKYATDRFNEARKNVGDAMDKMKKKVSDAWDGIVSSAKSFGRSFAKAVSDAFAPIASMGAKAKKWGSDIVDGLVGGLQNGLGKVKKTMGNIADATKGVFTGKMKIFSPSRVFMGYGNNIGEGLAIGMEKTGALVKKASEFLGDSITPPPAMAQPEISLASSLSRAMSPMASTPGTNRGTNAVSNISNTNNTVSNSTNTTNNENQNGVVIQNAKFEVQVQQMQTADDMVKLRKNLQNIVSDDLFGKAVRNL